MLEKPVRAGRTKKGSARSLLNSSDLRKLSHLGREVHFRRGGLIFREGERGETLYWLVSGSVQVSRTIQGKGNVAFRILRSGTLFGEMGLFTGRRRSASCQALEPSIVLEIPGKAFKKLIRAGDTTAAKLIHYSAHLMAERLDHLLELIGSDTFSASVENPTFLKKLKVFWAV